MKRLLVWLGLRAPVTCPRCSRPIGPGVASPSKLIIEHIPRCPENPFVRLLQRAPS